MKKSIMLILLVSLVFALFSCLNNEKTDIPATDTEIKNNILNSEELLDNTNGFDTDETENNVQDDNETSIGGSDVCEIHNFGYHCYPMEFEEYVGHDVFVEWINNTHIIQDEEGCWPQGNVLLCIEYFDIPDEIIIEAYQNDYYNKNWHIEALLSRDATALESHARNSVGNHSDTKLFTEKILKLRLFDEMERKTDIETINYYNEITNNGTHFPVCEVSISEMVLNTSISREDFEDALGSASSIDGELFAQPHFDYNLNLLFNDRSALMNAVNSIDPEPYESRVKLSDALLHVGEEYNNHEVY